MSRSARIKVGAWQIFVELMKAWLMKFQMFAARKVLNENKESWDLCSALTRIDSMGRVSQHSVRFVMFLDALSVQWWGKAGREGRGVKECRFKKWASSLLPWAFAGWHQVYPLMQVYEIGVVGCLAQEEMTLPGIPGPSPVGPSLLHPVSFSSSPFSLVSHFSRSWT